MADGSAELAGGVAGTAGAAGTVGTAGLGRTGARGPGQGRWAHTGLASVPSLALLFVVYIGSIYICINMCIFLNFFTLDLFFSELSGLHLIS